jgi:hypothetical protein
MQGIVNYKKLASQLPIQIISSIGKKRINTEFNKDRTATKRHTFTRGGRDVAV